MTKLPQFSLAFFILVTGSAGQALQRSGALCSSRIPFIKNRTRAWSSGHAFASRRVDIARRNLELCFPDMKKDEREKLLLRNFESVGMGVIETGIAVLA